MQLNKLNLGCGPHAMDGWWNFDLEPYPGVSRLDLSKGLPEGWASNSVDFIFTEHFIEHVTKKQGLKLLMDCCRVLKPGGVLRIATPDLDEIVRRYFDGDYSGIPGVWEPESPCDMINEGLRFWGHQYVWDGEALEAALMEAGFMEITFVLKGKSNHPELRNLEVRPQHFEMYIEAIK